MQQGLQNLEWCLVSLLSIIEVEVQDKAVNLLRIFEKIVDDDGSASPYSISIASTIIVDVRGYSRHISLTGAGNTTAPQGPVARGPISPLNEVGSV